MDVSWQWLQEYVDAGCSIEEVTERLTMSGLNHESTKPVGQDFCIDLEVTSNRADCLGHLGVAREIAVLFGQPLKIPDPQPATSTENIDDICRVRIESAKLCQRYTARLIKGVKIGPSPSWLVNRLKTVGIESVNNVVDVSNYVMMECGQPLHTFDFSKIDGGQIVVREPLAEEMLAAINHVEYSLQPGMCVIADQHRPIAIGGVMGGLSTEISMATTDVLIEAAWFAPAAIRATARTLNLHSDSSFRFERNVNVEALDWASRRCAQLILEVAGGELVSGMIDVDFSEPHRVSFDFRLAQIPRVLGVEIPKEFVMKTLLGLGLEIHGETMDSLTVLAPSWRKDLTREIDLIEEIGRIFGYENVPDNVAVPMSASHPAPISRLLERVRRVLSVSGFDEAMCPSLLPEAWSSVCSPWTDHPPLISHQPMLGVLEKGSQNVGAVNCLRRTLIPSLLEAKRINEHRANTDVNLYETANVYLPHDGPLPTEPLMLGLVSGRSFFNLKGVIEAIIREVDPAIRFEFRASELEILDISQSATVWVNNEIIGHIGQVTASGLKQFRLKQMTTVAELDLSQLGKLMVNVRRHQPVSEFPAVTRDFNFVMDEQVAWDRVEALVRDQAGHLLETISFREIFRNEKRDGANKKRVLLSIQLRSSESTLSGPEVESICTSVVEHCGRELGAVLAS